MIIQNKHIPIKRFSKHMKQKYDIIKWKNKSTTIVRDFDTPFNS